ARGDQHGGAREGGERLSDTEAGGPAAAAFFRGHVHSDAPDRPAVAPGPAPAERFTDGSPRGGGPRLPAPGPAPAPRPRPPTRTAHRPPRLCGRGVRP